MQLQGLRRSLAEEESASKAQREEFERLRKRLRDEEEAGRKMVEKQRRIVDVEEEQRARVAVELAALQEKHLTHDSELSQLKAQRDQMKAEKKELLKEEKKQLKAVAKLKEEVEEGVRKQKERTDLIAGLKEAKAAQDKAAQLQRGEVEKLERAIAGLQEKAASEEASVAELQAKYDALVEKEAGMKGELARLRSSFETVQASDLALSKQVLVFFISSLYLPPPPAPSQKIITAQHPPSPFLSTSAPSFLSTPCVHSWSCPHPASMKLVGGRCTKRVRQPKQRSAALPSRQSRFKRCRYACQKSPVKKPCDTQKRPTHTLTNAAAREGGG